MHTPARRPPTPPGFNVGRVDTSHGRQPRGTMLEIISQVGAPNLTSTLNLGVWGWPGLRAAVLRGISVGRRWGRPGLRM